MLHKIEDRRAARAAAERRRAAALDRLRAAVDSMDRENRALRAEVAEFQGVLGDLRSGFEALAESTDGYRLQLAEVNTAPLRRAALRLEAVADGWLDRGARNPGVNAVYRSKNVA